MVGSRPVKGVVLCGGKGSRLRPLSYYIPKPMVPIGRGQRPLLEYVIRLMSYHDIKDILLLIGHKGEQVRNYFRDGGFLGVRLSYLRDDPSTPGTGGAILNALRKGMMDEEGTYLIYYGDILSDIDLSEMLRFHGSTGAAATLAVSTAYTLPVSVAELDGSRIIRFEEKPAFNVPVGIGILAVEGEAFKHLHDLAEEGAELDLMKHFLPRLIELGLDVRAYVTGAFWYDVGSLEKYEKLNPDEVEKRFSFLFEGED
ncbi:MAG TPA: nucleotidyltransferase family protein [Candidatus Bathyarchaeota archaeon]|nr:nucleotidyltransferase family protein [Candidatus Bathyarchaeota archaeon]